MCTIIHCYTPHSTVTLLARCLGQSTCGGENRGRVTTAAIMSGGVALCIDLVCPLNEPDMCLIYVGVVWRRLKPTNKASPLMILATDRESKQLERDDGNKTEVCVGNSGTP